MQAARSFGGESAFHQIRPATRAPGGARGDGNPATTHSLDAEFLHDVQHLVAPDPTPSPADQPVIHLAIPVHRHEPVRVDHLDVACQRPMTRPHPTGGTLLGLPVGSGGEKPASQRGPQGPCGSARPQTWHDARRYTRPSTPCRVEPRGEKSRRRGKDPVRPTQLCILPAQAPGLTGLLAIRSACRIGLGLPAAQ